MNYDSIPTELKERTCWICWREEQRDGEPTKVPVNPHTGSFASSTDSDTWGTFQEAADGHASEEIETSGIGFVFDPEDTLVGIDLDDCRDPETGQPTEEAKEIINSLDSWTEVSPSGTGYHVFVQGFLPDGGNRGDIDDVSHLEMYDKSRFFTVTGDHVDTTPHTVNNRAETVRKLHSEYVATEPEKDDSDQSEATEPKPVSLEDSDLIEKAKNDDKFSRLWRGDTSLHSGDHSRADLALCSKLAFWTGGDEQRIDSLFRDSGLMRDKWDEQRGTQTYGEMTVEKAVSDQTEFYDPDSQRADGGATIDPPTTAPVPDNGDTVLTPATVKLYAGLDPDERISSLTDREKAAFVWKAIRNSDSVHIRVNRDNDELWSFDPETGTWSPDGVRALRHAARRALEAHHYGGNVLEELKTQVRADPLAEVWGDTFGLEAGKVAVENGLLDLAKAYAGDSDALRDLEPEDYALNRLPVEYDPEADKSTWYSFVGDVVETPMIETLQEYVGYCLHRENLFERALLLVGGGANGKSTFLNTIEAMLGDDNTTSVSPFDFGDKPSLARMHGGLANVSVELEGGSLRGKNLANFKSLTGNDSIQAKRLYQGPFDFKYNGGMLFATNEVPDVPVSDDDTAFWRRWIIVHFDNQFPEGSPKRDPTLGDRLTETENLSAVLNWAIEGWGRLLDQSEFTNVPDTPDTTREQWQSWGDSVDYFLSNVATRDDDAPHISTSEAWEVYRTWCRENGYDAVGQAKFTNAAKDKALGYTTSVRTDRHNTPRRGYKSFGTVEEEADPVELIEENDGDDSSDGTRNSGLGEYDTNDNNDDDSDGDGAAGDDHNSPENTGGECGNSDTAGGDSDPDPKGGDGENGTTERENARNGSSGGESPADSWSQLLADISEHYSSGEKIEADGLADRVDRDVSALYIEKGLEALADAGVIEGDGDTYRA